MNFIEFGLFALVAYSAFWVGYLVVLPIWGLTRKARPKGDETESPVREVPRVAVLIPAHDMAEHIGACLSSLTQCGYPAERLNVYVIADHCTDGTADVANASGAVVLVRHEAPPGKSYAIAWALQQVASRHDGADLYIVIDATVEVVPSFLSAIVQNWAKGEDVIVGFASVNPRKQQWYIRCMGLTLVHRRLQNEARERLRLSSLIEGRAMAYSHSYVDRFGWRLALPDSATPGAHPTEDWRHGVRVAEQGIRVSFAGGARAYTPIRDSLRAATRQGLRWEQGRIGNAATHGLRILGKSVAGRNKLQFFAALDAIQPPIAVLAGLSGFLSVVAWLMFGVSGLFVVVSILTVIMMCYAYVVIVRGKHDGIALWTMLWAPLYLLWRIAVFAISLIRFGRVFRGRRDAVSRD